MLNHEKASLHEDNYSYLKFAGTMLHIRFRTTKAVWVIVRAATWKKEEKKKEFWLERRNISSTIVYNAKSRKRPPSVKSTFIDKLFFSFSIS